MIKLIGQHIPYRRLYTSSFYPIHYMSERIICGRSEKKDCSICNVFSFLNAKFSASWSVGQSQFLFNTWKLIFQVSLKP